MVLVIKGVFGNRDLSWCLDHQAQAEIEAAMMQRIDTFHFTLFDKLLQLAIPDRAEIIVYDVDPSTLPGYVSAAGPTQGQSTWTAFPSSGAPVVDPPASNTAPFLYNYDSTYKWSGQGALDAHAFYYDTMPPLDTAHNPANWTARLFAGYVGSVSYRVTSGLERNVIIAAQDYTTRIKQSVINTGYGIDSGHAVGWSDQDIIRDAFLTAAPDIDLTYVGRLVPIMPAIAFPVQTLEQLFQKVRKVSSGFYRLDYYKRLQYGLLGSFVAPLNISDNPNPGGSPPSIAAENMTYDKDGTSISDQLWVVGGRYSGGVQSMQINPAQVNGAAYVFTMPVDYASATSLSVTVNGQDQGQIGTLGNEGQLGAPAGWTRSVLMGTKPPIIAFQTPPPAGATIIITGKFMLPLIQIVTSSALVQAMGGVLFEGILRDTRIYDPALAAQMGQGHLAQQGSSKGLGSATVYQRGVGGALLQPGQTISITNTALFSGGVLQGGGLTLTALINRMVTRLTPGLGARAYSVEIEFSDRPDLSDEDLFDILGTEQSRVNAALAEGSVGDASILSASA